MSPDPNLDLLGRMRRAVEKVQERLDRATRILDAAGIPYAVIGGNGVASWVATVDKGAVRNTRDVDILLDRKDLERTKSVMASEGFVHRHVAGVDLFLDGPEGRASDAVHVIFAGEKVRKEYFEPAPLTSEVALAPEGFRVLALIALTRMKLTSFRTKDQMHLRDLIDVGLVGRQHCAELPPALAERLAWILDHPED